MAPRGSRGRSVSPADARAYLAKATSWVEAAAESLDASRWDVAAGSAVTAGINACDAISGMLLGRRAGGEHAEAVALLEGAGEEGRAASRQLARRLTDRASVTVGRRPGNKPGARG
jgi:hypothetical protein